MCSDVCEKRIVHFYLELDLHVSFVGNVVKFSSFLYLQKSILLEPKPISVTLYFHSLHLRLAYWVIYIMLL